MKTKARNESVRVRLSGPEKKQLARQARARGKAFGFEGESAYIRWLIEWDKKRTPYSELVPRG